MGISRTVSEINGDLRRKSQKFPIPVYFAAPLKGFPLELDVSARDQKTTVTVLQDGQKSFMS